MNILRKSLHWFGVGKAQEDYISPEVALALQHTYYTIDEIRAAVARRAAEGPQTTQGKLWEEAKHGR